MKPTKPGIGCALVGPCASVVQKPFAQSSGMPSAVELDRVASFACLSPRCNTTAGEDFFDQIGIAPAGTANARGLQASPRGLRQAAAALQTVRHGGGGKERCHYGVLPVFRDDHQMAAHI